MKVSIQYDFIRNQVLVSSTTEAKAAYAHKTLGLDIDIGAELEDDSIEPTFSASLIQRSNKYVTPPITLRAT